MTKPNVHTTHSNKNDNWRNVSEGASKPSKVFETKYEAKAAGRQIAINNGVEHIIHNEDGKIAERNSYGNDPFPPRG
jgi:ketosteroid isomerase-like protein